MVGQRRSGAGLCPEASRRTARGMKVLIINVHSTLNLGDAVILQQMVYQIRHEWPSAQITVASNNPSEAYDSQGHFDVVGSFKSWVYGVDRAGRIRYRPHRLPSAIAVAVVAAVADRVFGRPSFLARDASKLRLIRAYFSADIIVNSGGHVLTTRRLGAFSYLVIIASTLYGPLIRKPLYMFPQTIGPFAVSVHRLLAEAVLRNTRLVLIRDRELFGASVRAGTLLRRAISVPDAAFGFAPGNPERGRAVLARVGVPARDEVPSIGITVIQWAGIHRGFRRQPQYEDALLALIQHIVHGLDGRVLLFGQAIGPSCIENDLLLARKLQASARLPSDRVVVVEGIGTPRDLMDAYGTLDFLVGTRMHSTIMAMASCVPVLAIAYTMKKHRGLFSDVGLERWVCDIETIEQSSLIEAFQCAWAARAETSRHLRETIPGVRSQSLQVARMIAQDLR